MKKLLWMIFAILPGFVCLPVRADLITIAISGQITSVSDQNGHFENKIHIGDTIAGTYTYDSAILDINPDSRFGDYLYNVSPAGIYLTINDFEFKTNPDNVDFSLGVANDSAGHDGYSIFSRYNLPLSDGTPVQYINWELYDSTGTALSSDALPLTAPDLSKWDSSIYANQLAITHDRDFGIVATVTSAVLVPEPLTISLMIMGVLFFKRRR